MTEESKDPTFFEESEVSALVTKFLKFAMIYVKEDALADIAVAEMVCDLETFAYDLDDHAETVAQGMINEETDELEEKLETMREKLGKALSSMESTRKSGNAAIAASRKALSERDRAIEERDAAVKEMVEMKRDRMVESW